MTCGKETVTATSTAGSWKLVPGCYAYSIMAVSVGLF